MSARLAVALCVLLPLLMCAAVDAPAQESPEAVRKVVTRIAPQYPTLARSMNIRGTVKMMVTVAPNGSPKSIEVKGGNPILVQSAEKAVRDWRWEPAPHATSEEIDLRFDPR